MSGGKGGRKNREHYQKNKIAMDDEDKGLLEDVDNDNLVLQQFRTYAAILDDKHDRFERIIKLSRDITIESKKIIFLLHRVYNEKSHESLLREAKSRLDKTTRSLFKNIASELKNQDPYLYLKAYRGGLEEYIEAVTFYQYLANGNMESWMELEKTLTYTEVDKSTLPVEEKEPQTKTLSTLITPNEYILGIADLTGELMRKCISNLAAGDITSCYEICNFVRDIYVCFLGCTNITNRGMTKKLFVLKQSLTKMENTCYTIKVRGAEIPKHMLADIAMVATESYDPEVDEGYQAY
ncbi:hypothetical protein KM043_001945 [Ampulex compressa]|nr:hypothetical protein KM043_001945 [Ampulex compressa]